jgi:hypothetical protein
MAMDGGLNKHLPWYQVLEALGYQVEVTALPAKTVCPSCRAPSLRILEDTKFGGAWHYCDRCRRSGDMLALAMRHMPASGPAADVPAEIAATLQRLRQKGIAIPADAITDQAISDYRSECLELQRKAADLMVRAAKRLHVSAIGAGLAQNFDLAYGLHEDGWPARMGRFLGTTLLEDIKETFPWSDVKRLLGKKSWKRCLIIPFQNLPGRCCGFLIIGRHGTLEENIYCPLRPAVQRTQHNGRLYIEPGLVAYEAMLGTTFAKQFGRTVFVGHVFDALRLQARHLAESLELLPLVGMHWGVAELPNRQPRRCANHVIWETQPNKHFIFFSRTPEAAVFNAASRCDGAVVLTDKNRGEALSPMLQLIAYREAAQPWFRVLIQVLSASQPHVRYRLLQELDLTEAGQRLLYEHAPADIQQLLNGTAEQPLRNWISFGRHRVVSTASGWYREPGQMLISTGKLIIEKTLLSEDTGELFYSGKIVAGDREAAFLELAKKVEYQTLPWMQQIAIKAGIGPLQFDKNWSRHMVQLAMQFQAPITARSSGVPATAVSDSPGRPRQQTTASTDRRSLTGRAPARSQFDDVSPGAAIGRRSA